MIIKTRRKPRKRKRIPRLPPAEATALGTRKRWWRFSERWPYTRDVTRRHHEFKQSYWWKKGE